MAPLPRFPNVPQNIGARTHNSTVECRPFKSEVESSNLSGFTKQTRKKYMKKICCLIVLCFLGNLVGCSTKEDPFICAMPCPDNPRELCEISCPDGGPFPPENNISNIC